MAIEKGSAAHTPLSEPLRTTLSPKQSEEYVIYISPMSEKEIGTPPADYNNKDDTLAK